MTQFPHRDHSSFIYQVCSSSSTDVCPVRCYLGSDGGCGDVGGAVLEVVVVVVVVHVPPSPHVLLLVLLLVLALGAALHGVHVGVEVHVGQQRGGGGQLLQGGVRVLHLDDGLTQQVDGMRQSRQDELETLLQHKPKH